MFFREREPEQTVWRRFRSGLDGFAFEEREGVYEARVVANAERVVDLFHALAEHLSPAVDVVIEDRRGGRSWRGEAVALPDVRDAIARLKVPLATYGGVEVACFTAADQLTLSAGLDLFVYARTDRWYYILTGKGLEERRTLAPRTGRVIGPPYAPAPELEVALAAAVERLALAPA